MALLAVPKRRSSEPLPAAFSHDGQRLRYKPLRLLMVIDAPQARVDAAMDRHPHVKALRQGGWFDVVTLPSHRPSGP
ncbi:putative inorganic carbon transporter subunit DabA [Deinococcus sonorensis]|uniref:Inorganic carbon transporter subunit DabA n=1 Tax=Deinococcus sonorensis TaxID=309891 RepID=A0ABV8YCQ3_9DEIO